MAHTPASSPKPAQVKEFHKSWWLWVIGALCVLALFIYPSIASCGSPTSGTQVVETPPVKSEPPPKPVEQKVTKVVKYQLDPVKWTEWISIAELKPPEVPDDARFEGQVNAPGWHEYRFTNGKEVRIPPDPNKPRNEEELKRWLGTIPGSTFKLRGEGEAIVRIDYFFYR